MDLVFNHQKDETLSAIKMQWISQGRTCLDKCTCCHTETQVADQLAVPSNHSVLIPGLSDLALNLSGQTPGSVAAGGPMLNTSLTKSMYLRYLACVNKFGLPPSASCPVNSNVNDMSSFGVGFKRTYTCFYSLESQKKKKKKF